MTRRRGKGRDGQGLLPFPNRHGGWREGAGRKPGREGGVSHGRREAVRRTDPVLVTMKLLPGLPRLRRAAEMCVLRGSFEASLGRFDLRLVDFSVQGDHIHLIFEAESDECLSRGVQGLAVRIARGLNRVWGRTGTVFRERYHALHLRSRRQMYNALRYVLNNHRKHGIPIAEGHLDPFSSGAFFEHWAEEAVRRQSRPPTGWLEPDRRRLLAGVGNTGHPPVLRARTWLRREGWQGVRPVIGHLEIPGPSRARARARTPPQVA